MHSLFTQATLRQIRDAFTAAERKAELAAARMADLLAAVDTLRAAAENDAARLRTYFQEAVKAIVAQAVAEFAATINGPNGYEAELHRHNLVSWWISHGGGVVCYPKRVNQRSVDEFVTGFPAKFSAGDTVCSAGDIFGHWNGATQVSGSIDHLADGAKNTVGVANWIPVMKLNSGFWCAPVGYVVGGVAHVDSGNLYRVALDQVIVHNVQVLRPDGTYRSKNIPYQSTLPFTGADVAASELTNLPLKTIYFGNRIINVPAVLDVDGAPMKGTLKIIGGGTPHGVPGNLQKWPVGEASFQFFSPQAKYKFAMNFYGADRQLHRVPAVAFTVSDTITVV